MTSAERWPGNRKTVCHEYHTRYRSGPLIPLGQIERIRLSGIRERPRYIYAIWIRYGNIYAHTGIVETDEYRATERVRELAAKPYAEIQQWGG